MKRQKQEGMALVVTLIMLAVILVITVAFLAVARRDRASVTQAANMTDTEFMADAGRERAVADLAISMMTQTNIGLLISTNADIDTNTWTALTVDPRPPVFIRTAQGLDFRCYLDLDRNGVFERDGIFRQQREPGGADGPECDGLFHGGSAVDWGAGKAGDAACAGQSIYGALCVHSAAGGEGAGFELHSQPGAVGERIQVLPEPRLRYVRN